MKLPPMALTAPSLCPRCDSPALTLDECAQCSLPLRRCGSCFGVAGPFDRFCGFCGHELVLGRRESPAGRLWLLAGLVPILAALAIGLSPLGQAAVREVTARPAAATAPHANVADRKLGFTLAAPAGWSYSNGALLSEPADAPVAAGGAGGIVTASPKGAVVILSRPTAAAAGVDPTDPVAVLAAQTAQLTTAPPTGLTLTTVVPVSARTVAGHRAAISELTVVGPDGTARLFERVYVSDRGGLFAVEGLLPLGDGGAFNALLLSLRLTS